MKNKTLTNEIIEEYRFKKVNNSMWRLGKITLQNTWVHRPDINNLRPKYFDMVRGYKVCHNGKYLKNIANTFELNEVIRYACKMLGK